MFHASVLFFTFEKTYDAYVHIFFADHYASNWFESWNFKWYTGFTITSYPPLVHQIVALLSKLVGLKMGFYIWSICAVFLLVRGSYKFSLLWVSHRSAGIAAILTVFCSSIVEALHIFGQVPSLTGIAFLLNACPEIYKWFRYRRKLSLALALALLAVTTSAHHVTTIFGMVFFVLPVIGLAVMDKCIEDQGAVENVTLKNFVPRAIKEIPAAILFGLTTIMITLITIFPYWYWSKTDPIAQVSIPHGSRENFLLETDLGIIFFLIPWGMMLLFLPYLFKRVFQKRNIFLGLSIFLAFILGTGGTTPIPRMILGNGAFEILTLDRFTFWATLMSIPFWGAFINSLLNGAFKKYILNKFNQFSYQAILGLFFVGIILVNVIIVNLGFFKPFQPEKINIKPITNFLSTDQHDQWRYLTLGFGDQVAWLAANTEALTVDGNYHSVRRLPEMTTRAVERLENAKYQGMEGLGALQDFLTIPDKYNLKYIFSNDKFYEPLLHFSGWDKVTQLENNIIVWERPDVKPLPTILPSKSIPYVQRIMWGTLPLFCFILALIIYVLSRTIYHKEDDHITLFQKPQETNHWWGIYLIWAIIIITLFGFVSVKNKFVNHDQSNPESLAVAYFDALDFKEFERAYGFLDSETKPSIDQYILELSVEDGILASFAKLDNIKVNTISKTDNNATVIVDAKWITSLTEYSTQHELNMVRQNGRWEILKAEIDKATPPDQFYSLPDLKFKNQGRRKTKTNLTSREDVLDRPEISILSASLISTKDGYHVVGEIQNIDNVPSYVSVESILYDRDGNEISKYNAMDVMMHDLTPKEITPFRIDFGDLQNENSIDNFVVFVKSIVTDKELYKYSGIIIKDIQNEMINGEMINFGTHEINVPQLLFSQYNDQKEILWAETKYLQKGIRSLRKKPFDLTMKDNDEITVIRKADAETLFVNGVPNSEMTLDNKADLKKNWLEYYSVQNSYVRILPYGFVYGINK